MKKIFAVATLVAATAVASAQKTVTFTDVLDVNSVTSGNAYSATYDPAGDKFLVGNPSTIQIFNGGSGAVEGNLDITGITPSGSLGFFGLTATSGGQIYAFEDGSKDIWRWDSVADTTPDKAFDTPAFARTGYTQMNGSGDIIVGFTGLTPYGGVEFYTDSFPFSTGSFTFVEAPDLDAKSGMAFNSDATEAFTVGDLDSLSSITKYVKTGGAWATTPAWRVAGGGGPVAYDEVNDVVLVLRMAGDRPSLYPQEMLAIDGATGAIIGTDTLTNLPRSVAGYCGGYAESLTAGSGTVWMAAQGTATQSAVFYKWTYTVTTSSTIDDWSLYQP